MSSVSGTPGRTPQAATGRQGAGNGADRPVDGTGDDTDLADNAGDGVAANAGTDPVRAAPASDALAPNVENPGPAQAPTGNKPPDVATTAGPNDTLAGGGADPNRDAAGHGFTTGNGEVDFRAGVSDQQLWFLRSGNDLQVELLGTNDHMTISGWYADNARTTVQSFDTADGMKLDSQVAQLVSAMAAYSSANPGFDATTATQMPDDRGLQTTVAAAWHS